MAHHFYLPQLTGENITVPKEFAHWNNNERKIILGISDAITIDDQAKSKGVSSIPDIWARPLLFQSAVRPKSQHPLKRLCTQEWRGLLSLLALHKIKPELAQLDIVSITLDNETFSTALKNLVPNDVQLEKGTNYRWTDLLMIRFKGIAVGAFSPSTLVYTGVDYNKKLAALPFSFKDKNGFLAPPETREDGLEYIGEWLYILQQKLNHLFYSDQVNPDHPVVGNINDMIGTWLNEIRQKLGLKENDPINVRTYKVTEEITDIKGDVAPFLNNYNIYQELLRPLKKDENTGEASVSDILLRSTRNRQKNIVVITEKIISNQVNIWDEIRPSSLGINGKAIIETFFPASHGTKINDTDIGKKEGMWIRPELYFLSNKLLRSREGKILSDSERELNINQKFLLPFKKEILDFFSPKEIKENLKPVYSEDTNIVRFSFTLPVGDTNYKIEKVYKTKATQKEDGEILEIDVPVIEIFPDYLGTNWRKYFLFHGNAESYLINPLTENRATKTQSRIREYQEGEFSEKVKIHEISGDSPFPEAAEVNNNQEEQLGLILIDKKDKQQGLKDKWTIGIDFGTSNTNVFKNRGTADSAERWSYDFPNYYRTLTTNNSPHKVKILEEYFFPTRKVNLPIPTTLKIYNKPIKNSMVLDYFIYYPVEYKFPENILSDFKWDGDGTECFLESLLFLLLIEVVKNNIAEVDLASSYPKAFSTNNITVFQRIWEKIYDKLLKPDENNTSYILNIHRGLRADNDLKVNIKKPVFKTEGIAAGEYFASEQTIRDIEERANKEIAAICLDVGGGTTDISIWYLNKIEFDASVLLAGRQISNLLQINNRARELLFSKEAAIALEEKRNESVYFSARLNLVLKNEEEYIQNNLVKHSNNKDIQWLRQIIALEFGALSFFAAEVCVSTNEKVGGLLSRIASDGIHLHWGGNAAKLINWIDFGRYSRQGIASKILNATFFKCLDDISLAEKAIRPKTLMQLQSPGHKSEAAGGLVVMDLSNYKENAATISSTDSMGEYDMPEDKTGEQSKYAGIICGEDIELSDGKTGFFMPITNKDLFDNNNNTKFKATTLARLTRFIEVLNFFGIKNGLFTEDTKIILGESEKRIIRDGVLKEFIKMQRLTESQRLIEPVFIMEIKILLDILKSKMS